jgi:hypothetical protein
MPSSAFDYAVIRVVPRVDREEFVNVGVVLHSPEQAFLAAALWVDPLRLQALSKELDLALVERHLRLLVDLCAADPAAGPLADLTTSERFHWVVATRSTVVQTSPVHGGLAEDLAATLEHLMDTMVR